MKRTVGIFTLTFLILVSGMINAAEPKQTNFEKLLQLTQRISGAKLEGTQLIDQIHSVLDTLYQANDLSQAEYEALWSKIDSYDLPGDKKAKREAIIDSIKAHSEQAKLRAQAFVRAAAAAAVASRPVSPEARRKSVQVEGYGPVVIVNDTDTGLELEVKNYISVDAISPISVALGMERYTIAKYALYDANTKGALKLVLEAGKAITLSSATPNTEWQFKVPSVFAAVLSSKSILSIDTQNVIASEKKLIEIKKNSSEYSFELHDLQGQTESSLNEIFSAVVRTENYAARDWDMIDVKDRFGNFSFEATTRLGINQAYKYKKYASTAQKTVIFIIHGTWAGEKERTAEPLFAQRILAYGQELAESRKQSVEVLIYSWSGQLSDSARMSAGNQVADIIRNYFMNDRLITVAHSHGGNVALAASNILDGSKKINLMMNFATPVLTTEPYIPSQRNVAQLLAFYSTGDIVQLTGATSYETITGIQSSRKYAARKGVDIKNVRVQLDGADPLHSGSDQIRALAIYMSIIIEKIYKKYSINSDLDMNVMIDDVSRDPIQIAIRQHISDTQIIANDRAMSSPENLWKFMQTDKGELEYSEQQSRVFFDKYGRNIRDKASSWWRSVAGVVGEASARLPTAASLGARFGGTAAAAAGER